MSKAKIHPQVKISFYHMLASLLAEQTFPESRAKALVELHDKVLKPELSFEEGEFCLEFLKEVHSERLGLDPDLDLDLLEDLVTTVFKDLSRHFRDPKVRRIFRNFLDLASIEDGLFINTVKARHLADDCDGPTVVTLVVNDYRQFQVWLNRKYAGRPTLYVS